MRRLVRIMLLAVLGALAWVLARELLAEAGEVEVQLEERSKDELYEEAKRLGIEGRSKMSKEELAAAIAAASGSE